jgi:hypothetical protein
MFITLSFLEKAVGLNSFKNKTMAQNCHNYCRVHTPATRRPSRPGQSG